jgi:hypothetical protein
MCSMSFERTTETNGTSLCRAYVTNYGSAARLAKIDETGVVASYTSADPTPLNGVAVPRNGSQVFGAMVNTGAGTGNPGMALRGPGASTYSRVKGATATGSPADTDNPFDQLAFNQGPVGPAFDYVTYSSDPTRKIWFGNFKCPTFPLDGTCACLDNGLCKIDFSNGSNWSATPETYCNQACTAAGGRCDYTIASICPGLPERITAIAFDQRMHAPSNTYHRFLIVAHGTTVSLVDLDGGTPRQRDVNLANAAACNPDPAWGESTVQAVLSTAAAPFGDVILEVRGAGDKAAPGNVRNTWLVNLNDQDLSCRHELEVQRSLEHVNPCPCAAGYTCVENVCLKTCGSCPTGFACSGGLCRIIGEIPHNFGIGAGTNGGNGRLAVLPSGRLLRWVAAVDQTPAGFAEYNTTPSAQVSCDDANLCTVDTYDPASGLCAHAPVVCDDSDLCTTDTCQTVTGNCLHTPVGCDDGNACTADTCDPGTGGCLHAPIVLTEPGPLLFVSSATMQWPATADAIHWNTYRGTIPDKMLGSRLPGAVYDQACFESADALGDGPTTSTDAAGPPAGTGFYYLVSGEAACESLLGRDSSGTAIPNASPCPTPP